MASITYDAQSFMIDGRRAWITSGSMHYARMPRSLWAQRMHDAKEAGLNTIETPVVWSRHEPRAGQFNFDGDNDIRHFVELAGAAGLHVILRPGPFIRSGYDLGGLPAWLPKVDGIALRTASQPFLEATSRYFTALARQVKDLQVTSTGEGGPILLIQCETSWTCGNDTLATQYLGELNRYLREAGLTVPTINNNSLWQGVEGEIDAWSGYSQLLSHLRQFSTVRPNHPRLVIDFALGRKDCWGTPVDTSRTPDDVVRKLAEVLAAGAQFNIEPFHGGSFFEFAAGRWPETPDSYQVTSADGGGPVDELGRRTPLFHAVRRLCQLSSSFGRVFSSLDPRHQPITLMPGEAGTRGDATGCTVAHAFGSQGGVAFVFAPEHSKSRSVSTTLLRSDGSIVPVTLGSEPVAWCMFNVRLTARAMLDYCSLSGLMLFGSVFVCFGPAGAKGRMSINDSPIEVEAPRGKLPIVFEHEGVTVVVANTDQTEQVYAGADAIYLGVAGLDQAGQPIPVDSSRQYTRVSQAGAVSTGKFTLAKPPTTATKVSLSDWTRSLTTDYTEGTNPRYASIAGPADLPSLGAPYGYGWYRIRLKSTATKKRRVLVPESGDRLHLVLDGEHIGVCGYGPGAEREVSLSLKKGDHTLVGLSDNLGRFTSGTDLDWPVGVWGHLYSGTSLKAGKGELVTATPVELLSFRTPLWQVHVGDVTGPSRMTWTFQHRRKSPIIMTIEPLPCRGLVLLNDVPIRYFDAGRVQPLVLDHETLNRGKNTVQIATVEEIDDLAAQISQAVEFTEGEENLTDKAEWAFAKWEQPPMDSFEKVAKNAMRSANNPVWWRCVFTPKKVNGPVLLDLTGMSKGQMYVNGQHLGRYFVGLPRSKSVSPQHRYAIPQPWIGEGEANDIVLFDEHGHAPTKVKIEVNPTVGLLTS